jgi:hypothetical protein
MRFVQDHLQANVDKESSLKYLKRTYAKYLTGIVEEEDPADYDQETQAAVSS